MALRLGATALNKLYLGGTAINKAYLGANVLFSPIAGFNPATMFGTGIQGAWYDPSDLTTLFRDTAVPPIVPVTAAGQSVGTMLDKSGNDNHIRQSSAARRPTYRNGSGLHWLEFDGVDDTMGVIGINLTGTNKMGVVAGVRKLSDNQEGHVVGTIVGYNKNPGAFHIRAPSNSGAGNYGVLFDGDSFVTVTSDNSFAAPHSAVITVMRDLSVPSLDFRINSSLVGTSNSSHSVSNFGNYLLYIGSRNGLHNRFNGLLYGLIIVGKSVSTTELADAEIYMTGKTI